ncbi:MAG: hypothetical protein PF436_11065 [Prolixibacteraceae bacterium]|jgi:hypothetical protein|nr:hypothetical protein [Prolixibacteraceae bacterium]
MGIPELKKELHSYIDHADERFLKMVYAMSKEYKGSDIVGYKVDGSPISKNALSKRVLAASKRVKSGDFISEEEVEQEVQNW